MGSKGSFIAVSDALVQDGTVKWYCIPTIDNALAELESLKFVHVDELVRVGKRFPSSDKRCEVQHKVVSSLNTCTASEWVAQIFGEVVLPSSQTAVGIDSTDPLNSANSSNRIWIGPNFPEKRILVLGESWYGSWADNTDHGYITLYLAGKLQDGMYTRMANATGLSKANFWNGIAFTNYVQRTGDSREDRPTPMAYEHAGTRLRALIENLQPKGVWILGKEQAAYSQKVLTELGVPNEVTAHPTSYGLSNDLLGQSWSRLLERVG